MYLPVRNVPSTHITGRQCLKASMQAPKEKNNQCNTLTVGNSGRYNSWMSTYVPGFRFCSVCTSRTTESYASKYEPNLVSNAFCLALQALPYDMLYFNLTKNFFLDSLHFYRLALHNLAVKQASYHSGSKVGMILRDAWNNTIMTN